MYFQHVINASIWWYQESQFDTGLESQASPEPQPIKNPEHSGYYYKQDMPMILYLHTKNGLEFQVFSSLGLDLQCLGVGVVHTGLLNENEYLFIRFICNCCMFVRLADSHMRKTHIWQVQVFLHQSMFLTIYESPT